MRFGNLNDWHSDRALEEAGVAVDIGGGRELIVKRNGARNRSLMAAMQNNDPDTFEGQARIAAAAILVGWRGLKDEHGAEVPFTADNAVALFKFAPDLLDTVMRAAHDRGRFHGEELEADKDALKK